MVTWDPQAVPDLSMLRTEPTGEGLGRDCSAQPAHGPPWLRFQVGTGDLGAAVVSSVHPQIKMSLGMPVQPYLREGAVWLELLGGGGTFSEGV